MLSTSYIYIRRAYRYSSAAADSISHPGSCPAIDKHSTRSGSYCSGMGRMIHAAVCCVAVPYPACAFSIHKYISAGRYQWYRRAGIMACIAVT